MFSFCSEFSIEKQPATSNQRPATSRQLATHPSTIPTNRNQQRTKQTRQLFPKSNQPTSLPTNNNTMSLLTLDVFECTNADNTVHRGGHLCWLSQGAGGKNNMLIAKLTLDTSRASAAPPAALSVAPTTLRVGLLGKRTTKAKGSSDWIELDALDATSAMPGSDGEFVSAGGHITLCPAVGSSLALRPSRRAHESGWDACVYLRLNTTSNQWGGAPLKLSFSVGQLECTTGPMMVMTKVKLDDQERCLAKLNSVLVPLRARPPVLPAAKAAQLLAESCKVHEMARGLLRGGPKRSPRRTKKQRARRLATHTETAAVDVGAVKMEEKQQGRCTDGCRDKNKRPRACRSVEAMDVAVMKKAKFERGVTEDFAMLTEDHQNFEWMDQFAVVGFADDETDDAEWSSAFSEGSSSRSSGSNSSSNSICSEAEIWGMHTALEEETTHDDQFGNNGDVGGMPLAPVHRQHSLQLVCDDMMELSSSSFPFAIPDVFFADSSSSCVVDYGGVASTASALWTAGAMTNSQTSCTSH
jgi:hypothetical protein